MADVSILSIVSLFATWKSSGRTFFLNFQKKVQPFSLLTIIYKKKRLFWMKNNCLRILKMTHRNSGWYMRHFITKFLAMLLEELLIMKQPKILRRRPSLKPMSILVNSSGGMYLSCTGFTGSQPMS